ncbi:hypothetical protein ACH5RR_041174 [Cinchona calisaya]|uniref:L-gulonolactone oxidase n=1 Tax=Cinchona calisaya TaxID=153742 RepID=A0ABD2XVW5_9GENT
MVSNLVYPKTEEELRLAVANATNNKLNVKVVTKFSHIIPKLACPIATQTVQNAILISTEKYASTISVDAANMTVTADSRVSIRSLIDKVEEEELSLVTSPYWEGVTVGGIICTGAHGSSWWGNGGALHDHVIGISLIVPATASDGYAKIIRIQPQDPLLNAAKVSLGMLGVISKVTFSLEPAFKRSITYNFTSDDLIEEQVFDHAKKHEFGDIQWYPSRRTAVYRYDDRFPLSSPGDGVNDFLGFQSKAILVSQSIRSSEKSFENARNVNGKCTLASSFLGYKKLIANGLKDNLIFTGYPVVGRRGKMQPSGSSLYSSSIRIDQACSWDPRIKGPHWAKNRNVAFFDVQKKYPNFRKFVASKKQLDPQNLFPSDWSDQILFGRQVNKGDGCAIFSEDRHCSPGKGYFCLTGIVYREARVCRYSMSSVY